MSIKKIYSYKKQIHHIYMYIAFIETKFIILLIRYLGNMVKDTYYICGFPVNGAVNVAYEGEKIRAESYRLTYIYLVRT